jgi:nitrite reductase/ring-hydroxylating ferredoxin subunit
MSEMGNLLEVCDTADVSPDTPFKALVGKTDVAVFQVGDAYYVTQDLCTHGPGSLCEGFVEGDEVECPFHQGKFSITTGLPTAAPCVEALKTWKVFLQGDKILVASEPAG